MTESTEAAPADGAQPGTGQPTTFTQADVDRIVSERITRERGKFADYADLKTKASKYDDVVASQQTETEKAVNAARQEAEASVRSALEAERVLDKVEVLAAKDFADPEDARLRLAGRAKEFVKDGKPDAEAITAALKQLLTDKPHLAATPLRQPRPAGNPGQGPRGEAGPSTDMNALIRRAAGVV